MRPLCLRLSEDTLERADKLVSVLTLPGYDVTRADVLRRALLKGLADLEKETRNVKKAKR